MKALPRSLGIALTAGWLLFPVSAQAQANFAGSWMLNDAASDLRGMRPPKSDVITMQQRGKSFAWSEVIVTPSGKVEREAWSGKMDGVARPVQGPKGNTASYKMDGTSRWMSPEGNSDLLARVSADGKQFLLTSTTKLPDGRSMTQTFVYDRTK